MKAELNEITEKLTGNKELAKVIMDNLNAINDMLDERDNAVISRLSEIKLHLSSKIDTWGRALDKKINNTDKKLNALLNLNGIDPKLLTED